MRMFKFMSLLKSQKKLRKALEGALRSAAAKPKKPSSGRPARTSLLQEVIGFGSNPGGLTMKLCAPRHVGKSPPLVIVLHGCRQTAESLDTATGFSTFAHDRGFVLLYPEQTISNNPHRCFNWFRPSSVARDRGELMSVKQMIEHACVQHRVDRSRIYIVGLSAGASLVSALVATYPETFAGAAMIAGMPFGAARDAMSALRVMGSGMSKTPGEWSAFVRAVSPQATTWPPISIWQGTDDAVVNPSNARASVIQWLELKEIHDRTSKSEPKPWGTLTRWKSGDRSHVSFYSLHGFGHGLPIRENAVKKRAGSDPYVIAAGISAPLELLRIWGLRRM